jgi:transposase
MATQKEQFTLLIQAILPEDLFKYFEITNVKVKDKIIDVYLDVLNQPPASFQKVKLTSKGFHGAVTIQDFPIRERAVFLHVRRRKWKVEHSGKIISNSRDTIAAGTRYTKGFASFLKELFGQLPNQQ